MYNLNEKICNLQPYTHSSGGYKVRLDANESAFELPCNMLEDITSIVKNIDFNRYPDPTANKLCKAFAKFYDIDYTLVTAGNGSDELISVILSAFLMKNDKLVVCEKDFSMYNFYANIFEIECITFDKKIDLNIDIDNLIKCVNENNAKAVIFSNPCNPTSKTMSKDDIVKLINNVNALVILDEAYMDFWNETLLAEIQKYDNLIILRTASKAVGLASLRLGFAVACEKISNAIKSVKSPYNVNTISQEIGTYIYQNKKYLLDLKNYIVNLRQTLYNSIKEIESKYPNKIEVIEGTSNFIFIKTPYSKCIYDYLLDNDISIRYMGDYIRITAGKSEENEILINHLKSYLFKI